MSAIPSPFREEIDIRCCLEAELTLCERDAEENVPYAELHAIELRRALASLDKLMQIIGAGSIA